MGLKHVFKLEAGNKLFVKDSSSIVEQSEASCKLRNIHSDRVLH